MHGFVLCVVALFVFVHVRAHLLYARIETGQSLATVIEILGEPRRREPSLIFCAPYFPWDGECPDTAGITGFIFFKVGIDRWIVVGVDDTERVIFRTMGDT